MSVNRHVHPMFRAILRNRFPAASLDAYKLQSDRDDVPEERDDSVCVHGMPLVEPCPYCSGKEG